MIGWLSLDVLLLKVTGFLPNNREDMLTVIVEVITLIYNAREVNRQLDSELIFPLT